MGDIKWKVETDQEYEFEKYFEWPIQSLGDNSIYKRVADNEGGCEGMGDPPPPSNIFFWGGGGGILFVVTYITMSLHKLKICRPTAI